MTSQLLDQFRQAAAGAVKPKDIPPRIRFAKIKPTNNCNSKCITCTYWEHEYKDELTLDEVCSALEQLRNAGVEEVMFSGGEPTLRKDLPEMVARAHELGFSNVGMTTNSLSLNPGKIEKLLESGLTEAVLSLEGIDTHDSIRGVPGNLTKVRRNLEYFSQAREKYPAFRAKIAMTLMNRTLDQVQGVLDLARQHDAVFFVNLIDGGTYFFEGRAESLFAIEDPAALTAALDVLTQAKQAEPRLVGNSLSSLNYARRYFDDPKQASIPCYLGYVGVDIDNNGDVYSNCWGLPPVGNLRRQSLSDIIDGPDYARQCAKMYRKACQGCSCGYILNLAYHPDSVDSDRAAQPGRETALGYAGERF